MPTLKGTWKFNEKLTKLPTNMTVSINFETKVTITGHAVGRICSAIIFMPEYGDIGDYTQMRYMVVSPSEVDAFAYTELGNTWAPASEARQITLIGEQEVPSDFYDWFVVNATQAVLISYNGEVLDTLFNGESVTAHTGGTQMEGDIIVEVPTIVDSHRPPEIATEEEMTTLLDTAEVGSVYKYAGATTAKYENGVHYIKCEE